MTPGTQADLRKTDQGSRANAASGALATGSGKRGFEWGRWDFVRLSPLMGGISLLATVVSIALLMTKGLNYGIDFAGGTEAQVKFAKATSSNDLRNAIESTGIRGATVQALGDQNEFLIHMETMIGKTDRETNDLLKSNIGRLTEVLRTKFELAPDGIRRIDTVGPQVGSELKRNGLLAAFYSFLVILIYVAVRFDYKYAPGAVLCLVHDSIFTLGVFSLLGREFNVQIMAAVLTLIGYSLNDTIVTFDRIRETYPTFRDRGMVFVINKAVNDMLGRTFLTAGCTLLAVIALYALGGGVISEIGFTLMVGIVIGTYSSVYVAAPLILVMEKLKGARPVAGKVTA